ncbi:AAA domain-containing protein [Saccharopolyspora gregorii]|uniref:AAA domain-containing protein n=1 Tax=Saccharopolyspora gregorii TaxID=33914 RepID=A0ABP6RVR8_9PSEU
MSADQHEQRLDLVRAAAEQWAKNLIEFGPQNTLLHFKNTKTTSLDLANANPAFMRDLLRGKAVKLSALFEESALHKDACTRARSLLRTMTAFSEEQGIDIGKVAQGLVRATPRHGSTTQATARSTRAPLLLRSLRITARTAAESEFVLETERDVEINPVLLHALDQDYGLDLDLPAFTAAVQEVLSATEDPQEQVDRVGAELASVAERQGVPLDVEPAVVCGLFNYAKQPMVRDLQQAVELLAEHDLIAALAGDRPAQAEVRAQSAGYEAPAADSVEPAEEFLVQDADSSQQRAIDTALAGHHVLVEGPPGTGKSQTIANIIAGAAARGKRVLFVSEKRAAIEAVTGRLAQVGLDKLVFDLHQQRVDKKHVARQLQDSLESAGRHARPEVATHHRDVRKRRAALRSYSDELHRPRDPWQLSAFQVQAKLLELRAPASPHVFSKPVLQLLDADTATRLEEDLRGFIDKGGLRVVRRESPWWQAEIRSAQDIEEILAQLNSLAKETLHAGRESMTSVLRQTGLRTPLDLAGWQEVLHLLGEVNDSVRAFGPDVFSTLLDDWYFAVASRRERAQAGHKLGWLTRRRLHKELTEASTDGIKQRSVLHRKLAAVRSQRDRWQALGDPAGHPSEVTGLGETMERFNTLRDQLTSVALFAKLSDVERKPVEQVDAELDELVADQDTLWQMEDITRLLGEFERLGLGQLVQDIARQDLDGDAAWALFRHTWLKSLLDRFKLDSPALRGFTAAEHDRLVRDYRDSDSEHRASAADRVLWEVGKTLRQVRDDHPDETKLLREQANKKSRHMPLPRLVQNAPNVLLALFPCWAMSPLVVSRTLPAQRLFDLVIFDEASQIQPQDAIPTIARGSSLVVAGDDKQLPPSNFFGRMLVEDGESDETALQDYESILTAMRTSIQRQEQLQWHYRSRDERLIAFSNREIYGDDLVTFPGSSKEPPVSLHVVDGKAAPGQDGSAPAEVERVVDLVLEHAATRPQESLGVIAMGDKHAARIEAKLRQAVQERPDVQEFFDAQAALDTRVFVKNLERVQGDERDAIILTIGVAKRADDRVDGRGFGPLNRSGGERRLNVAVTRAKRRMSVVCSFQPGALAPSDTANGTELLRRYLEFAQRHGEIDQVGRQLPQELNGFEEDVRRALTERGLEVHPQWGFSGYRIDFALAHRDHPGRMVLAVEADGDRYHQAHSVRERDRLRQAHLENLGWRFHRVWASAWFADRAGETEKIVKAWEEAMRDADAEPVAEPPAEPARKSGPSPESRRGPRPDVLPGQPMDKYTDRELIGLCRWLLGDGLQLDREERITQAMAELGKAKRGRVIVQRLTRAVQIAQDQADREDR